MQDDAPPLPVEFSEREIRAILSHSPAPRIPADPTNAVADDPAAARLGQAIFFDERFSSNGAVSCATCHDPAQGFSDGRTLSQGVGTADRHAMSLWNVAHNRWFFWDGRADTLWAQALDPIENVREHDFTRLECAHLVYADPKYRHAYEAVFGPMPNLSDTARFPAAGRPIADDPTHEHARAWASMTQPDQQMIDAIFANLGKVVAAYERRLVRDVSPFDTFAEGVREENAEKIAALSQDAQRGLKIFMGKGNCRMCHVGPMFTDGEFHNTGVPPLEGGMPRDAGRYSGLDRLGRNPFNSDGAFSDDPNGDAAARIASVVRNSESWGQFKTPSLRNVELSAPYMHQGQFASLEEVLRYYSTLEGAALVSHHQEQILVPLALNERELRDLAAFLRSLTGQMPEPNLLQAPKSPMLVEDTK